MKAAITLCSLFLFLFALAADSDARAGRGKSSGFRSYDSKKYSPASPQKTPQDMSKAAPASPLRQTPSFLNSGLFKMLVGGLFIGAILSMLMGEGLQFGTPGLLEILIIAGLLYFLYRRFAQKKASEGLQYAGGPPSSPGYNLSAEPAAADTRYSAEQSVNEPFLCDIAKSTFKAVQDAWSSGDVSGVRHMLTDRMHTYLSNQMDELRSKGLRDSVEITYFRNVEVVEVAEEGEGKLVVVLVDALVRDYTVDSQCKVVEGSRDVPVDAKEYWAFIGKGLDWKLDDIRQAV